MQACLCWGLTVPSDFTVEGNPHTPSRLCEQGRAPVVRSPRSRRDWSARGAPGLRGPTKCPLSLQQQYPQPPMTSLLACFLSWVLPPLDCALETPNSLLPTHLPTNACPRGERGLSHPVQQEPAPLPLTSALKPDNVSRALTSDFKGPILLTLAGSGVTKCLEGGSHENNLEVLHKVG